MLAEFLNNQQSITCLGEVFTHDGHDYDHFLGNKKNKAEITALLGENKINFFKNRHLKFKEYLKIIEQSYSTKIFGYKIFMEQIYFNKKFMIPERISKDSKNISYETLIQQLKSKRYMIGLEKFINYLIEYNVKVIILIRENKLEQFISGELAKKVKYVHTKKDPELILSKDIKVSLDLEKFKLFYKNIKLEEQHNMQICIDNNINFLTVTYEDLTSDRYYLVYKDIIEFLGGVKEDFIDIKKNNTQLNIKQNTFKLKDIIENYDVVLKNKVYQKFN